MSPSKWMFVIAIILWSGVAYGLLPIATVPHAYRPKGDRCGKKKPESFDPGLKHCDRGLSERLFGFSDFVNFDLIADFDVVIILDGETTFKAVSNFFGVIFEALE